MAFHTLGCKLNFSETSTIARDFIDHGFVKVDYTDHADVYVINTCSVTDSADRKCRKAVRQAKLRSPEAFIAVTGCYAQLKPQEFESISGVDLVVGTGEKFNLAKHVEAQQHPHVTKVIHTDVDRIRSFESSYSLGERTRAFLKIQDGCDYPCTYCTIPLARGRSRSDTIENVLKNARLLARKKIREIILTGVNVGEYRSANGEDFFFLLNRLVEVHGIDRIRISSIEPNLITDEIIRFVAESPKMTPHFHIPLQSGSDKILRLMRRRYLRDLYRDRVQKIKQYIPHAGIGADVIVGFPGETVDDFRDTCSFIRDLDISYLHVFSYSERDNTPAKDMSAKVMPAERMNRSRLLHQISEEKRERFHHLHLGKKMNVLFETGTDDEWVGYTENYIRVKLIYRDDLTNKILPVVLTESLGDYMKGKPA